MALTAAEKQQRCALDAYYQVAQDPAMLKIEREICGCDYGASSWTTREEADQISSVLGLQPRSRLLDVGSGSGWPGLYLARITGCDLTLMDLPAIGLKIARSRALRDPSRGRCWVALADASALPFAANSFDALCHADLLCCLKRKTAALKACRNVLQRGGRMVFTVISVVPELSALDYRRAVAAGPEFIASDSSYPSLLLQTGWVLLEQQDITAAFTRLTRSRLKAELAQQRQLASRTDAATVEKRIADFRIRLDVLSDGLLKRELFVVSPGK